MEVDISRPLGNGITVDRYRLVTSKVWAKGSTMLYGPYHTLSGVRVHSPSTNAWVGAIEYSSDGGVTYLPFVCTDCTKGSSTARISVDGNSDVNAPTTCFGGAKCILLKQG